MRRVRVALLVLAAAVSPVAAQSAAPGWFAVPGNAVYQTGDSWTDGGVIYRLYGVQSCLRGTIVTNAHGVKRDCGEASLAMLIALTRDLKPQCYQAAALPEARTVFVFCIAQPLSGAGAGSRIDLGTALISTGYGFAALTPDGKPVHPPYFVAQLVAQRGHAGLWAFADLPEPNAIILRALRADRSATTPSQPTASSAPDTPGIAPP
ncbi:MULTISPECIES: thermonuclease family protein [Xanthobacteraceae]|jgi:endonuclease YncB( thermonuclease family)|uniref:Succinoglycan biosynthesis protein exoi n=1 Tax=Ancylobacter dichloromethanicus TaxID=518825 RepID=A0A9W6MXM9_9HYPH|nr:thermonuclease family protein [Ancylobacter dichloromethanicus]OYW34953.1 MAG: succinoglycan biosynthesis protein exoi [Rhizobiales bacterium 12-66-7]OYX75258.1 MAG: succinoglycan biosynthesis protein exoi [Rhizobiales bacterium 32-66-11]OYY89070.1 MAG: succinoglycan biosynthesis protein exoi [Rhizobiales bacterium 35-66-30]OYZ82340.1 MAG: succinoglycan biosynthesis protein exoi [Rhizobiales bacterium 24-66-13]OYZ90316.1 MAG: succinoglycan biosynthesis protein exoi [Rhizobiales bacterium 17